MHNEYVLLVEQTNLDEGAFWDILQKPVHLALDVAGIVPGLGEFADASNGLLYIADGKFLHAAISFISMIPGAGDFTKMLRLVVTDKNENESKQTLSKIYNKVKEPFWKLIEKLKLKVGEVNEKLAERLSKSMDAFKQWIES
jgi:hypothetical protein